MRYLILPLLLSALGAAAQTTRSVQPTQLWPELQGEVALRNGDYVLLALRGERSTQDGYAGSRRLGFDANRLTVGYEHFFWNTNWSLGATARLQSYTGGQQIFVPEVLVRHRSLVLGGFTFGQRLSVERTFPNNNGFVGGPGPDGQYWGRLRVDIERLYPLGSDATTGLALRPRISYEASTHLRFQKATNDAEERTIQFTSLRGEVGVRLSPNIDFTPWFAYQTNYLETLPQYDKNGVQTSGGKLNLVYPTVGLDLRFTIIPSGTKEGRQQLPTQH
jgi:hypothetical protein